MQYIANLTVCVENRQAFTFPIDFGKAQGDKAVIYKEIDANVELVAANGYKITKVLIQATRFPFNCRAATVEGLVSVYAAIYPLLKDDEQREFREYVECWHDMQRPIDEKMYRNFKRFLELEAKRNAA